MRHLQLVLLACGLALAACGHRGNGNNSDANGNGDGSLNGDATPVDALTPANCVPGATQCTDCKDNDGDGRSDGYDPECTGPLDNDEGSFATGIPGDNKDAVNQDCFFDGNSGAGQDCNIHVCCLLGATDEASCPIGAKQFNPDECKTPQSQTCIKTCKPLVPAGCDCFGCCTVCDPTTNQCRDILTNPALFPGCTDSTVLDPNECKSCVKVTECSSPCGADNCILCPGQDTSDLPASCGGTNVCPADQATCTNTSCAAGYYCANGCCIVEEVLL